MTDPDAPRAQILQAGTEDAGQRIDNYLLKHLKGVPRARIYRALRKGEVRVNGSRKKPTYHLVKGDKVRIPPIRYSTEKAEVIVPGRLLDHIPVLFEDDHMLVVNKPSGLAVHGGSGMDFGLIEAMRTLRTDFTFLELVHRLDRETSGCLMLAKSRKALLGLQHQLAVDRSIRKYYIALLQGRIADHSTKVESPLRQVRDSRGMKKMINDKEGQAAITVFRPRSVYADTSLVEAELHTGRMHQARAHAVFINHPIAGDRLYGDRVFNRQMQKLGLGRLFLHAERLRITHPVSLLAVDFYAPLPDALNEVVEKISSAL